jgi:two-component system sensor histidine kinase DctS
LSLLEGEIRQRGVRINFQAARRPIIDGDPILIEQILLNLLRNALDAMRTTPPEQRAIEIGLDKADSYASLDIADHGSGIDPAVADKLFDPLFSTKPEGMGMGLAICRSVVESHRGRLSFAANPGRGTVFRLLLPISETQ